MRWALCCVQHMMRSCKQNAFKSWGWALACFSGYFHHKDMGESCKCSWLSLKCTVEYTGYCQSSIFGETHHLHHGFQYSHIQIWGVYCQVILAVGLTLMDLQLFCSLWVWCSQCANDLNTLLPTTHTHTDPFLDIIHNNVISWDFSAVPFCLFHKLHIQTKIYCMCIFFLDSLHLPVLWI